MGSPLSPWLVGVGRIEAPTDKFSMLSKASSDPGVKFAPPRKQAPKPSGSVGHHLAEAPPHFPPLVLVATEIVQRNHRSEPSTVHLQDEGEISPTEFVVEPIESHLGDGAIVERVPLMAAVELGGH
jgi:hypothetical protein